MKKKNKCKVLPTFYAIQVLEWEEKSFGNERKQVCTVIDDEHI